LLPVPAQAGTQYPRPRAVGMYRRHDAPFIRRSLLGPRFRGDRG
jgi:hypothetical protein